MEPIGVDDALIRELLAASCEAKQAGHDDPFNLRKAGSINRVPPDLDGRFPRLAAAFQAAIVMSLHSEFSDRRDQLSKALESCQSPIEARFLIGLICACSLHDHSIVIMDADDEEVFVTRGAAWGGQALYVLPQAYIAGYRVDFGLCLVHENIDFAIARMVGNPEPVAPRTIEHHVVVECDGHDFHEKTKEQAAKDKRRDRDLLNEGHPVMRFTGSEIMSGPLKCAEAVMKWIFGPDDFRFRD